MVSMRRPFNMYPTQSKNVMRNKISFFHRALGLPTSAINVQFEYPPIRKDRLYYGFWVQKKKLNTGCGRFLAPTPFSGYRKLDILHILPFCQKWKTWSWTWPSIMSLPLKKKTLQLWATYGTTRVWCMSHILVNNVIFIVLCGHVWHSLYMLCVASWARILNM